MTRDERKARTRTELIDAADRLFTRQGFHATRLDAIAAEAGYTKGAVYSNFSSKEDLFFAVYERRAEQGVADVERALAASGDTKDAIVGLVAATSRRRGGEADGWLAVFFEFWAHVLRNPEHRERFAEIHAQVQEPLAAEIESYTERRGTDLPVSPRQFAIAMFAMTTGLSLERLVQPGVVDPQLNELMAELTFSRLVDGA